ncbi:N-acetylmuramoyl-L-alanine amidase [Kordiimonas pumila]|uniref:N-acetylmuramoyl-L-alanine amidase n=1 Tax=Kordiimonas pumila TaxID=2161677 RepID=A0ABV7D1S7_9PROT|nr:N-acetylmuramoyl-L-alanine amidase [Kordiimonas pumila]
MRSLVFLALRVSALLWLSFSVLAENTNISGVRFGQNGADTRFVIDMSGQVEPNIFLLANPSRVVIDLPNGSWEKDNNTKPTGVVEGYRHGLFSPGIYRIVLDLKQPAILAKSFSLPASGGYGDRYVIDLRPATDSSFAEAVTSSKHERPTPRDVVPDTPERVSRSNGKRIVVVDAGHGGVDPGTLGRSGENEKTLTLKISKQIKADLERTGRYQVYLTRDKDIYIPHRQRFGLAKAVNADLFISVHVDAIADPDVRGGTVYTLNENASDKEAGRLARMENKSDIIAGVDLAETNNEVTSILIELAQRETMNASAQYAEILLAEMRSQVHMHKRGHRFANLLVLKSPDVPSVLIETGYITNKIDARMLASTDGQKRIAKAVARATDQYFATLVAQGR